jgi:hypothetical protein
MSGVQGTVHYHQRKHLCYRGALLEIDGRNASKVPVSLGNTLKKLLLARKRVQSEGEKDQGSQDEMGISSRHLRAKKLK